MSTFRTPVGPQPSRIYWRRRLVVALGLVAVVVIIILIVVKPPGAAAPGTTPSPTNSTPAASASGNPTTPSDAVACDPAKVTVEGTTDATSYEAGVNPALSFALKSIMTEPCSLSVGTDVQEYKITSGDELIWSSKDCQTDNTPATVVLSPGVPKAGPPITWDRTRSSTDTCDTARDPVTAEGASYHLTVVVNGISSTNDRQFLLY